MYELLISSDDTAYNIIMEIDKIDEKEDLSDIKPQLSLSIIHAGLHLLEKKKEQFLHPKELAKLAHYTAPLRRKSYLMGRMAAKKAISLYLNDSFAYSEICITNGLHGEPKIMDKNINLSLSHSNDYAAALVTSNLIKIGIDIECLENIKIDSLAKLYTMEEILLFEKAYIKDKQLIYGLLWAAKEALVKYLETGFLFSTELLEISNIHMQSGYLIAEFKYFPVFQAILFCTHSITIAICLSRRLSIKTCFLYH